METEQEIQKNSFLSFMLGNELFALNVKYVLEVLENQRITRVPKTPDYIRGVINFRGEILPVIHTHIKFNMKYTFDEEKAVIIVLDFQLFDRKVLLGIMADMVRDVLEIPDNQVLSVPELGSSYNTDFLTGMWKTAQGFIMILDAEKVFSIEELTIKRKI